MAARRVSVGYMVSCVLLAVCAAGATFQLKYVVRDLERELAATNEKIERARWAVQADRADLAYLTRPERLVMQAQQLGMIEAKGGRVVRTARLPDWVTLQYSKASLPAVLPSGAATEIRARPMPTSAELGLAPD